MRISLVIPAFESAPWLGETLDSVLDQSLAPHEIIVVDDGSTDGSPALVERYRESHPESGIRLLRRDHGGASAARDAGQRVASGDALMFLDADDLLAPHALAALAEVLDRHPGTIACCPWYRLALREGRWRIEPPSCAPRRSDESALDAWLGGWYHPPCSVLWSREALERSGGWDPSISHNNDGDIMMRALASGVRLSIGVAGAAYYRRRPTSAAHRSISDGRRSPAALSSRHRVLVGIARRLAEHARLAPHRPALSRAFAQLARDGRSLDARTRRSHAREARSVLASGSSKRTHRLTGRAAPVPVPAAADVTPSSTTGANAPRTKRAKGSGRAKKPGRIELRGDHRAPPVSVVIPTFDRAATLVRAIDSVRAQRVGGIEILVVDDGSRDGTRELVASLDVPGLRCIHSRVNRGASAARNRGIFEARSSRIALLDSDDEWLPGKLDAQIALFERSPADTGLVYVGQETVDSRGNTRILTPTARGRIAGELLRENLILGGGSGVMLRREVFDVVGGFDESLPAIEDYDCWLRVSRHFAIDFVAEPLVRYHDPHDDRAGAAARRSRQFATNLAAREQLFGRHRAEFERAGCAADFLLESARRHLREPEGDAVEGRRLVLRALRYRPLDSRRYAWLGYMLLPHGGRAWLRDLEARLGTA